MGKNIEEEIAETRRKQAINIEYGTVSSSEVWDCRRLEHEGINDENRKEHVEECLGEMLYNYNDDERNYALDGAVISCDQMSNKMVHIQFREDGSKISIEDGGEEITSNYKKPADIEPEGYNSEGHEYIITSHVGEKNIRELHAVSGNSQSDNGILFATVADRSYLREEVEKFGMESDTTSSMSKVIAIGSKRVYAELNKNLVSIVSCGNCKDLKEEDIKKIAENWDDVLKYGTCYALMQLVSKWENPYCMESVVGECKGDELSLPFSGSDMIGRMSESATHLVEHHRPMKFSTLQGEKEGLTMMSTLLCKRGGIITIEAPGQIYIEPKEESIDIEWDENVKEKILELLEMENGIELVEEYLIKIKEYNPDYAKFLEILGEKEGSGRYDIRSDSKSYWGLYQIGLETFQQIKFKDDSGDWTKLAKNLGLSGKTEEEQWDSYKNNEIAQEVAILFALRWDYLTILTNGDDENIGEVIDGVEVTNSGLIAAGHLVGCGDLHDAFIGVKTWEKTHDGNDTSALYYMEEMGGLDLDGILVGLEEQVISKEQVSPEER